MTAEPNQLRFYSQKIRLFYLFVVGGFFVLSGFWLLESNILIKEFFVVWPLIVTQALGLFSIISGAICLYIICMGLLSTKPMITISDQGIEQEILFGKNVFISWSSILSFQYISVQKQVFLQITTVDQGSKDLDASLVGISAGSMMGIITTYLITNKINLPYWIDSDLYDQENPESFDTQEGAMDWLLQDKNNYRL